DLQAEDGIRDRNVTGVQTCALPIYLRAVQLLDILRPDHRAAAKKPAIEQIRKAAVVLKISCRQYIFIPHAFSFPSNAHPGFAFIIQERSCNCNEKSCILYKHTDSRSEEH